MSWYFEEKGFDGEWRPRKTPERPVEKRSEGGKRKLRAVAEIEDYFEHLTLDQLQAVYGPDGKFSKGGSHAAS